MTLNELVTGTFDREGRTYGDQTTHPPIDQPTGPGGIILPTLSAWRGHPCTVADLKALTLDEAALIIRARLQEDLTTFGFDQIADEAVQVQLLDFAYNSPEGLAVRWFQRTLQVPRTSRVDAATVAAANAAPGFLLNQALIAARLQMVELSTDGGSIDKHFEDGLEHRALKFSLLEVP